MGNISKTITSNIFSRSGYCGEDDVVFGRNNDYRYYNGLRFENISIPAGSIITSAKLTFTSKSGITQSNDFYCKIYAEDADSPAVNDCSTRKPESVTRTTAYVHYVEEGTTWTSNSAQETPDISTVIQEVIDRDGWAENNDLNIIILGDSSPSDSNNRTGNETSFSLVIGYSTPNMKEVFLTSGSSWTVPSDWNSNNNSIHCIGAGGGGGGVKGTGGSGGGGGGGGAYAKILNLSLTKSTSVSYSIGSGGTPSSRAGGDTWFNSTSTVLAKGSSAGSGITAGAAGGSASSSVGTIKYSGGTGGDVGISEWSGGGGGAAGQSGAGLNGEDGGTSGADPNNGDGGTGDAGNGGHGSTSYGGNGSAGTEWGSSPNYGSGGGGAGGRNSADGGDGGSYGAGGGGRQQGDGLYEGGTGGDGLIYIRYKALKKPKTIIIT